MKCRLFAVISAIVFLMAGMLTFFDRNVSGSNEPVEYYSDGKGCFYIFTDNKYLSVISEKGKIKDISVEGLEINFVVSGRGYVYTVTSKNGNSIIFPLSEKGTETSVILEKFGIYKNCLETDCKQRFYAVDGQNNNIVTVFDKQGDMLKNVTASKTVSTLFYSETYDKVYGITSGGILDIENEKEISCKVPRGNMTTCGNICTDSKGNVYRFDEEKGFVYQYSSDYESICASSDGIYAKNGRNIFILNETGKPEGYFETNTYIDGLISSGKHTGYYVNGNIFIIKKSDIQKMKEQSENEDKDNKESKILTSSTDKTVSKSSVEIPEYELNTKNEENSYVSANNGLISIDRGKLELSGNYLFLKENMTLAEIKKCMDYGDASLRAVNHNGKEITSGNVGTGWKIYIPADSTSFIETVLKGDVTGEGSVNSRDVTGIGDFILEKTELSPAETFAADIDDNGVIDIRDMFMLYKSI